MPSSKFGGFSFVLDRLRLETFNAKELMDTTIAVDHKVFSFLDVHAMEIFASNEAQFCTLLELTCDPCKLVTVAQAARLLNKPGLAEVIEDAMLGVCIQISTSTNGLDMKKKVFEALLALFARLNLNARLEQFTQALDNAVVKSSSQLYSQVQTRHEQPTFKTINVPRFAFYHHRPTVERDILKHLRETATAPQAGVMAVIGANGIGKTTTIAHLLTDKACQELIAIECQLGAAIWLNCYRWRDSFEENDAKLFTESLVKLCRQAAPDLPAELTDLTEIVHHLETDDMLRPVFIFDDMFNVKVVEYFRRTCPDAVCCMVTREIYKIYLSDKSARSSSHLLGSIVSIPDFDDGEVKLALETTYGLAGNLSDRQLEDMAKRCYRLPLIVGLLVPRFRFCVTSGSYHDEYNRLMNELLNTSERSLSESQSKTIEQLFQFNIESLEDNNLRTMYYAFLLFDPGEPVKMSDLAIIWGFTGEKCEQEAFDRCNRFEKSSLARRLVELVQDNRSTALKMPAFLVHQALHDTAFRYAETKIKNVDSIYHMRYKIVKAFCFHRTGPANQDPDGLRAKMMRKNDRPKILLRIIEAENRPLLELTIRNLDAQHLLQMCRLTMPQKGNITFLQYLFDFQWLDDKSFKGYRSREIRHSWRLITSILEKLTQDPAIDRDEIGAALRMPGSDGNSSFFRQFLRINETIYKDNEDYRNLRNMLGPWLETKIDTDTSTQLIIACRTGHMESIEIICDKSPKKVEFRCKEYGRTALSYAAGEGYFEIMKYIFEKFPKAAEIPDKDGRTPLTYAVDKGHVEIVKFLYHQNPKTAEMSDKYGRTPVSYAAERESVEVINFLLYQSPMAAETPCKYYGRTPLSYAAERGPLKMVKFLYEKCPKAGLIACNFYGRTPLSYAAERGHLEMVRYLLLRQPNAAEMTDTLLGRTPLSYAAERGHLELAKFLLDRNKSAVRLPCKMFGRTPLAYAAEGGNYEMVKFLYDHYPKAAEIVCSYGRTPLSYAAEKGHLEIVKYLFKRYRRAAEIACQDNRTPKAYAQLSNRFDVVDFLSRQFITRRSSLQY